MTSQQEDSLWKSIERFKTLVELIATLVVLAPVLLATWNLMQQGLTTAVVPAWLVLLAIAAALLLGYSLGRTPSIGKFHRGGRLIEKIDFEYPDSPIRHGWQLYEADETQVGPKHLSDGFVGNALEIKSPVQYALDYPVSSAARLGKHIEFVVKFEGEAYVHALVSVHSKDASKVRNLWLSFTVGAQPPKRIDDGSESWYEWIIWEKPKRLEGNWLLFRIDLNDAVARSAGKEGWKFAELLTFRLRKKQSIAHISVYE